jgi:hypothetical protein
MFSFTLQTKTEGVIKATGKRSLPSHPSYGHICKRINKRLNVAVSCSIDEDGDYIILAVEIVQESR